MLPLVVMALAVTAVIVFLTLAGPGMSQREDDRESERIADESAQLADAYGITDACLDAVRSRVPDATRIAAPHVDSYSGARRDYDYVLTGRAQRPNGSSEYVCGASGIFDSVTVDVTIDGQ